MNKHEIDEQAEREAHALRRQGRRANHNENRTRQIRETYSQSEFEKLFVKKGRE